MTEMCLTAFSDEAVTAWVLPEPSSRREHMRVLFGTSLRAAVEAEALVAAFSGEAPVAASIWIPRGPESHASEPSEERDGVTRRWGAVHRATEARHPRTPHLYLASMATLPEWRGQGAGAAMLGYGLERAHALGLPVYLEASTPENQRLYRRHGFHEHGEPLLLPNGGPVLQPMWLDR